MNLMKETEKIISVLFVLTALSNGGVVKQSNLGDSSHSKRTKRHSLLNSSKICKAFGCKNGECVQSELRNYRIICSCYSGYEGRLCDRLVCPYDCGLHGTCVKDEGMLYCKCDRGYLGVSCNSTEVLTKKENDVSKTSSAKMKLNLNSKLLSIDSVRATSKFVHPKTKTYNEKKRKSWLSHKFRPHPSDFHSHAEIDTSVRPEICAPGFKCYHGRCDRDAMSYGIFRCLCQENYSGLFCEKRCTLNCLNDGYCTVLDDGHQYCVCPFEFTGYYCEKRVTKAFQT